MQLSDSQERLLLAHREIDVKSRKRSTTAFISGWETEHDIGYESLAAILAEDGAVDDALAYTVVGEDDALRGKIRQFHGQVDGSFPRESGLTIGAGSSPLVCALMTMLSAMGETEVFYLKPVYHTYYYMAKVLGIRMTAIGQVMCERHESAALDLPKHKCVLLVTDPAWIAGYSLSQDFWSTVRDWQQKWDSLVVVDGTFQYTKWQSMAPELSTLLDPENTLRLVCPTKSLCAHGLRFAYVLSPSRLEEELGWVHTKFTGSSTKYDLVGAHLLMDQLMSAANNRDLVARVRSRYLALRDGGYIRSSVAEPDCTYYAFGAVSFDLVDALIMNRVHFELDYPDEYIRINLLSPFLADLPPGRRADDSS